MVGKTRNIAIQLVLEQCYRTSCTFFGSTFFRTLTNSVTISNPLIVGGGGGGGLFERRCLIKDLR